MDTQSTSDTKTGSNTQIEPEKLQHDLKEREKELNCMYAMADIVETPGISIQELLQKLVTIFPPAWQYPEVTCARIIVDTVEYKTPNFKETSWKQSADLKIKGKSVGSISVFYLEERPQADEGSFLLSERKLIDAIAERLSRIIERRRLEEKFSAIFMANRDALMTIEPPSWKFTSANPATIKLFNAKDEADFLSYEPWRLSPEKQPDGRLSSDKAKEMIEKAMKEGVNLFEWVHKKISGEEFYCEVLLSRVTITGSTYIMASVRDISAKKLIEEKLSKHSEELEKMNELMVDRELKMIELKKQIQETQNTNIK